MHGQFVWYELTTPDVDAAIRFYPRFTGWGTQAFDRDYTMWTTGGVPLAGIFRLNDGMKARGIPPNWMPYVETDDVDATAAKASSLGATIMAGPDDIPGTGRFAVIQDPQGAVFGIYKSNAGSSAWDGTPVVGRFSWHELMTHDHTKAAQFYSALFGWEKIGEMDMGGGLMYYMFGRAGKMYGGMFSMNAEWSGMHPFWLCYINVKDVGKAVSIATKAGATIQRPQMDIPGGSIAILGDPQGAGFALHHLSDAAPAPTPSRTKASPKAKAAPKAKAVPKAKAAAKVKAAPKKKTAAKKRKAAKKATRKAARPTRQARKTASRSARATSRKPARKTTRRKANASSRKSARKRPASRPARRRRGRPAGKK